MAPDGPISIRSVTTHDDGLAAVVFVSAPEFMSTAAFPGLAARALGRLPGLVRHPCDSGHKRGIEAELADTETPHLLEHVALELLACEGHPRRDLRGRTSWDFARDGRGVFCVTLSGASGAQCERALREAVPVVTELLGRWCEEGEPRPQAAHAGPRETHPKREE